METRRSTRVQTKTPAPIVKDSAAPIVNADDTIAKINSGTVEIDNQMTELYRSKPNNRELQNLFATNIKGYIQQLSEYVRTLESLQNRAGFPHELLEAVRLAKQKAVNMSNGTFVLEIPPPPLTSADDDVKEDDAHEFPTLDSVEQKSSGGLSKKGLFGVAAAVVLAAIIGGTPVGNMVWSGGHIYSAPTFEDIIYPFSPDSGAVKVTPLVFSHVNVTSTPLNQSVAQALDQTLPKTLQRSSQLDQCQSKVVQILRNSKYDGISNDTLAKIDSYIRFANSTVFKAQVYLLHIVGIDDIATVTDIVVSQSSIDFAPTDFGLGSLTHFLVQQLLSTLNVYISEQSRFGKALSYVTGSSPLLLPNVSAVINQIKPFTDPVLENDIVTKVNLIKATGNTTEDDERRGVIDTVVQDIYLVVERSLLLQQLLNYTKTYQFSENYGGMINATKALARQEQKNTRLVVELCVHFEKVALMDANIKGAVKKELKKLQKIIQKKYNIREDLDFVCTPVILLNKHAEDRVNNKPVVQQANETLPLLKTQLEVFNQIHTQHQYVPPQFLEAINENFNIFIRIVKDGLNATLTTTDRATLLESSKNLVQYVGTLHPDVQNVTTAHNDYPEIFNTSQALTENQKAHIKAIHTPIVQDVYAKAKSFLSTDYLSAMAGCPAFATNTEIDLSNYYDLVYAGSDKRLSTEQKQYLQNQINLLNQEIWVYDVPEVYKKTLPAFKETFMQEESDKKAIYVRNAIAYYFEKNQIDEAKRVNAMFAAYTAVANSNLVKLLVS